MNDKQFIETYCQNCGTQRCGGIGTEWFEGCKYKWNHDSYDAASESERSNNKIMTMAREKIGQSEQIIHTYITTSDYVIVCPNCEDSFERKYYQRPYSYCPSCGKRNGWKEIK